MRPTVEVRPDMPQTERADLPMSGRAHPLQRRRWLTSSTSYAHADSASRPGAENWDRCPRGSDPGCDPRCVRRSRPSDRARNVAFDVRARPVPGPRPSPGERRRPPGPYEMPPRKPGQRPCGRSERNRERDDLRADQLHPVPPRNSRRCQAAPRPQRLVLRRETYRRSDETASPGCEARTATSF